MVEEDKDLADLPSFRFYAELDKGYENLLYGYDDFFEDFVKVRLKNSEHISNIKESLLNAFIYIANMRSRHNQYDDRWDYLYYWTGDKVYKIVQNVSDFKDIMGVIDSLKTHVDNNSGKYNDDLFKIEKDQFINLKKLYDYSQNYQAIKLKTAPYDYKCSYLYNKYIKDSYELYSRIKTECSSDTRTTPYCRIFRNIEINNLKDNTSRLLCFHVHDPIISEEKGTGRQQALDEKSRLRGSGDGAFSMGTRGGSLEHYSSGSQDNETSAINSGNPTAIILPVLGLFIMSFLLYKFTPLKTMIHNHFIRKKINQWDADADTIEESLIDKYEIEDDNSEMNSNHIGYIPIRNR
ncbi:PIR Superfamily Protein [Plasmodium ovale curtisi]|uniref:PIR Superfamily Protein n=1 Tax=Plasmodium ovale curtisi TaxID=864141 RepID=A0A1A8WWA4_PLAOA|nr:PIR Superfamily Protein [Plasmodium ovale curtisi]